MPLTRHLTFANVASATALAIALGGGGVAVASGALAHNSVGSAQLKKNAVHSSDIKNGSVKGKDIKVATLGTVPWATNATTATTAGRAASAALVDKIVFSPKVTAAVGQSVTIGTKGPLTATLVCTDFGSGEIGFEIDVTTSVDGAAGDSNVSGDDSDTLNVGDTLDVGDSDDTEQAYEQIGFSAMTPAGELWTGYGHAVSKPASGCAAQLVFLG